MLRKWLILGLKDEKQLRNKNNTEDWALSCYPRDNGHVTQTYNILSLFFFFFFFFLFGYIIRDRATCLLPL